MARTETSRLDRYLLLGWMIFVISFTSIPTAAWAPEIRGVVLLRQGIFYALLAFLLCRAWFGAGGMSLTRVLQVTAVCAAYGFVDEWHQSSMGVLGREANVYDWLASCLGGLAAAFVMWQRETGDFAFLFAKARGDVIRMSLSNLFNNGVTFLTGMLVAYLVSSQSLGIYSVAVNVVLTGVAFTELGLSISIVRYFNKYTEAADQRRVLQAGLTVRVTMFALILVASFPVGYLLSILLSKDQPIVLELTVALICAAILGLWSFVRLVYQAQQNYAEYAGLTMRYGMIRLFLVTIMSRLGPNNALYFLVALYLLGPLVMTAWELLKFRGRLVLDFGPEARRQMADLMSYGKWVMVGGILYPFTFSLPLFLIMRLDGPAAAGIYGIGLMFVATMSPLNEAVRTFILPKISGLRYHAEANAYIARVMRFAVPYALLMTAVGVGISIIYGLFFRQKYPGGLLPLELLTLSSGLTVFGGVLNSVAHYLGLPHLDAWVNVGRIVFVGAAGLLAIPHYGATGAAVGVAIATVSGEILVFTLIRRRLRSLS